MESYGESVADRAVDNQSSFENAKTSDHACPKLQTCYISPWMKEPGNLFQVTNQEEMEDGNTTDQSFDPSPPVLTHCSSYAANVSLNSVTAETVVVVNKYVTMVL